MIKSQYRKCPKCNEVIEKTENRCKHCGEDFRAFTVAGLFQGVVALGLLGLMLWAFISWEMGSFDDPPPSPPKVPEGGVRYEGQIYGPWENRPLTSLNRALQEHGAFCPDYKYRESVTSSSEYIVYCLMEYEGRMVAVDAYVVFPRGGTVIGPVTPDRRIE